MKSHKKEFQETGYRLQSSSQVAREEVDPRIICIPSSDKNEGRNKSKKGRRGRERASGQALRLKDRKKCVCVLKSLG